jgi:hypothetical protein
LKLTEEKPLDIVSDEPSVVVDEALIVLDEKDMLEEEAQVLQEMEDRSDEYQPISYQLNNMNWTNLILSHTLSIIISSLDVHNIAKCWVLPKNMDLSFVKIIMTTLKINQHLLPRPLFAGFSLMTTIYQVLPVAHALCDNNDFIIIFATYQYIDRIEDYSIQKMNERFPKVVEYGRIQRNILSKLG